MLQRTGVACSLHLAMPSDPRIGSLDFLEDEERELEPDMVVREEDAKWPGSREQAGSPDPG